MHIYVLVFGVKISKTYFSIVKFCRLMNLKR